MLLCVLLCGWPSSTAKRVPLPGAVLCDGVCPLLKPLVVCVIVTLVGARPCRTVGSDTVTCVLGSSSGWALVIQRAWGVVVYIAPLSGSPLTCSQSTGSVPMPRVFNCASCAGDRRFQYAVIAGLMYFLNVSKLDM